MKPSSLALVIAQFVLIALVASPIRKLVASDVLSMVGLILIALAVLLAVWALRSMSSGTFQVLPEPTKKSQLTMSGPYRFVRHPMYSAVILAGIGAALSHSTFWHAAVLIALIAVLILKIYREESFLLSRYENYASYLQRSKALIPFIY